MNIDKTKAIEQMAELKKEMAKLEAIINKPDIPTFEQIVEELKPGWINAADGSIYDRGYAKGLIFRLTSKESAIRANLRIKWVLICEWVNISKVINWSDSGHTKHFLYYNFESEKIEVGNRSFAKFEGAQYFISEEDAKLALSIMTEKEWLKMEGIK